LVREQTARAHLAQLVQSERLVEHGRFDAGEKTADLEE
jgi:hypothetical protein